MEWSELDFLNDMPVLKIYDTKKQKICRPDHTTQRKKKKERHTKRCLGKTPSYIHVHIDRRICQKRYR
jgi:hypothetical protein